MWPLARDSNSKYLTSKDGITRDAEIGIIALDSDRDEVDILKDEFEQLKIDLENEKNEIEQGLNNSTGIGNRRQTARRIEQAYVRLGEINNRSQQVMADFDSINARATNAGALISTYLIVPYTNPVGFCDCYEEKKDRLAPIDTQANIQRRRLGPLFAQLNSVKSQVFNTISLIPGQTTTIRIVGSLTFLAAILAFILFGWNAAILVAIIGLLVLAMVLIDYILTAMDVQKQILAIR